MEEQEQGDQGGRLTVSHRLWQRGMIGQDYSQWRMQAQIQGDHSFSSQQCQPPWLDGNHAIFGEVIEGMENVYKIEGCDTKPGDRPYDPQKIISVTRL